MSASNIYLVYQIVCLIKHITTTRTTTPTPTKQYNTFVTLNTKNAQHTKYYGIKWIYRCIQKFFKTIWYYARVAFRWLNFLFASSSSSSAFSFLIRLQNNLGRITIKIKVENEEWAVVTRKGPCDSDTTTLSLQ